MYKTPQDGGCWFCYNDDDLDLFCWEFDTFIHLKCIINAMNKNNDDMELPIIVKEFKKIIPKDVYDKYIENQIKRLSKNSDELTRFAKEHPAPQEWYDENFF